MAEYGEKKAEQLKAMNLHGYILKKKSPSCGMERVKAYQEKGMPINKGIGLFARSLMHILPNLPVEEEGRLNDPGLRENLLSAFFVTIVGCC